MDGGVITDGFLDLERKESTYDVAHGVDLSHHNKSVGYEELVKCGANFAIIKADYYFNTHSNSFLKHNISVIPYYYLDVVSQTGIDYRNNPQKFSTPQGSELSSDALKTLAQEGRALGKNKAESFLEKYREKAESLNPVSVAGLSGRIVAIDVEEYIRSKNVKKHEYRDYGRFYASMLAGWVSKVKEAYPDMLVLLYTFPDMYVSYLQYALPEDNEIIQGLPIWLAHLSRYGDDINFKNKGLERLCNSTAGGNRCIVQQYTHRGVFGVIQPKHKPFPPIHIDIDRMFYVNVVETNAGKQYVRRDVHSEYTLPATRKPSQRRPPTLAQR